MDVHWTRRAVSDLVRLHEFLAPINAVAAARLIRSLAAAPAILQANPRLGRRLDEFAPRKVGRISAGDYEIRYEIRGDAEYVLRLWHTREDR